MVYRGLCLVCCGSFSWICKYFHPLILVSPFLTFCIDGAIRRILIRSDIVYLDTIWIKLSWLPLINLTMVSLVCIEIVIFGQKMLKNSKISPFVSGIKSSSALCGGDSEFDGDFLIPLGLFPHVPSEHVFCSDTLVLCCDVSRISVKFWFAISLSVY